jgi:hypothetical protein
MSYYFRKYETIQHFSKEMGLPATPLARAHIVNHSALCGESKTGDK